MNRARRASITRALIPALAVVAVAAFMLAGAAVAGEKEMLPEGQQKVTIPVKGMTCGGCASAIKTAVKKLDGIVEVAVDHEGGKADVTFVKDKVTVKKIVEAINKTGFEATEPKETKES